MAGFIDTVIESLKQTLNWPLFFYFFAVQLVEAIIGGIVLIFFVLFGLLALFGLVGQINFSQLGAILSNPATFLNLIGIIVLLFGLLVLVMMYVSAFFLGIRLNLFNNFLKEKKFDLAKAFQQTRPRALTFFKIDLLITVIFLFFFGLLFLMALAPVLALFLTSSSSAAAGPLFTTVLLVLLLMLLATVAIFFVSPILLLLAPVAFFEEEGVLGSIKRSVALVKANYWGNIGFVLVYFVILMGVSIVINIVLRGLSMAFFLPVITAAGSGTAAATAGIVGGVMAFGMLYFIILVPYTVWSAVFQTACFRNLYFLDLKLALKPERKARKSKPGSKNK